MKSSERRYKEIQESFSFLNEDKSLDYEIDAKIIASKFLSEIQDIAECKNINRKKLSEMIGTSQSYVTQLFRGNRLLNLITLVKIKKALDLEIEIKVKNNPYNMDVSESNTKNVTFNHIKKGLKWDVIRNVKDKDPNLNYVASQSHDKLTA